MNPLPCPRNELKEAGIIYDDFCTKINEKKDAILQNKKHLEELIKQEVDTKADLESWRDKVSFETNPPKVYSILYCIKSLTLFVYWKVKHSLTT